jgi:hypothetical protein
MGAKPADLPVQLRSNSRQLSISNKRAAGVAITRTIPRRLPGRLEGPCLFPETFPSDVHSPYNGASC